MSDPEVTRDYPPVDICRAKHPTSWWITCQLEMDHFGEHVRHCPPVETGERLRFSQYTVHWQDPCECDSHTGVGEDLWKCDECGEVIRYIDDPEGNVTLTELHPHHRSRRVRVEMVTPGTRPWQDPCECDSHTGVGEDLWKCDECGEVIRYIDDPEGNVTLTELHPHHRSRRVRVEMVTPGTRPGMIDGINVPQTHATITLRPVENSDGE